MKDKIANYIISEVSKEPINQVKGDDDLLSTGLIDSLGMMKLIAFIESEAQIKVPPEDMTVENFMTIDQMMKYITDHTF